MVPSATRHPVMLFALTLLALATVSAAGTPPPGSAPQSAFAVDDLFDTVTLRAADLSPDGRWLAVTASTLRDRIGIDNYRYGDPTYIAPALAEVWIVDTPTAERRRLFPELEQVRSLKWSPGGERLAFLLLNEGKFEPMVWERTTGKMSPVGLPAGTRASLNTELQWNPSGDRLYFALQTEEQHQKSAGNFLRLTRGPTIAQSSKEPFLAWDDLRRHSQLRALAECDLSAGTVRQVIPELRINSYELTEDGGTVVLYEDIAKKTDYDVISGSESRLQVVPAAGGEARTLLKSTRDLRIVSSRNSRHHAYSSKGDLYYISIGDKEPRQLTGKKEEPRATAATAPETAGKPSGEEKQEEKESFTAVRLSPDGKKLIATSKEGFWVVATDGGARELFLKTDDENPLAPRYQVIDWHPDGEKLYLSYSSRTAWERGLFRYDFAARRMEELIKDARTLSGFQLSRDGSRLVFLRAENNRPADLFTSDADGKNIRPLVESNPALKGTALTGAELISYRDADGKRLNGVLYHPLGYEKGRQYPTVFIIYEQFFDDSFNGTVALLNAAGYAVMQPSVNFETGFPGEAWVKGVTAAANRLIEMGVADPDRLGIQGTSYGGYATNLLITQTHRFKAAINISGKVNMVSFYTDSPRLVVRNIHAPEKSQDRLGSTLWQQPQKYIQHSAIMFADRIKTPLLLITGEQDHNVPARQAMEMYYALRRLGKEVEWVQYVDGGHGMPTTTEEEVRDYHRRILDWYDAHLKKP